MICIDYQRIKNCKAHTIWRWLVIVSIRSLVSAGGTKLTSLGITDILVPKNPSVKVPDYEITIYEPKQFASVAPDTGEYSIKAILNDIQQRGVHFEIKNVDRLIRDSSNLRKSIRLTFGAGSNSMVIEELEVEMNLEDSRTQLNKCGNLKIFNPSLKRLTFLIPGNLIKIEMGYEATTNPTVFFGYISEAGVEWEGGDLALNVTMVPYIDGILASVQQGRYSSMSCHIKSDANPSMAEQSGSSGPPQVATISDGLKYIVDQINDALPARFDVKLVLNTDELESMAVYRRAQALIDQAGIVFTMPMTTAKLSIKDVINSFLYNTLLLPTKETNWQIIWWVDGQTIRFPHGQSAFYEENDVGGEVARVIKIGANAYKVTGKANVSVHPDFAADDVNPEEDRTLEDDQQSDTTESVEQSSGAKLFDVETTSVRRLVIMAIGMPDIKLGTVLKIEENQISEAIDTQLGSLRKSGQLTLTEQQNANMPGIGDVTNQLWVVDAYEHIFNSSEAFRTRIRVVPAVVAMNTNFRPSTPREQYKFTLEQDVLNVIDRFRQGFQGFSTPMTDEFVESIVEILNEDDSPISANEIEGTTNNTNKMSNYATRNSLVMNTSDANLHKIINWKNILDGNDDIAERRRYIMTSAANTSPWAMMYQTPKESGGKWVAAGIWHPKYRPYVEPRTFDATGAHDNVKPHYSQVVQRHLIHRIDNNLYLGGQDWNLIAASMKKTMYCYYTDYMIRSPARSVFLLPSTTIYKDADNQNISEARAQKDGGTATLIGTSILIESNPLIKRSPSNHPAHLNRPNIKTLLYTMSANNQAIIDGIGGITQLGGSSDPTVKHPKHASPIRFLWNMSDDKRLANATLMYYYRQIKKPTDTSNSDYDYSIPGTEWTLDNDFGKFNVDMTRMGMRLGDSDLDGGGSVDHKIVQVIRDSLYTSGRGDNPDGVDSSPTYVKDNFLMRDRQQYKASNKHFTTIMEQRIDTVGGTQSVELGNYVNTSAGPIDYEAAKAGVGSAPTDGVVQQLLLESLTSSTGTILLQQDDFSNTVVQKLRYDISTPVIELSQTDGTNKQMLEFDHTAKTMTLSWKTGYEIVIGDTTVVLKGGGRTITMGSSVVDVT